MANATVHPNHQLISSEDVDGTSVYSPSREEMGSIDHLMIGKRSGLQRRQLAGPELGG